MARHDFGIAQREDELGGKTLVIVGMGRIGSRLAHAPKAFGHARDRRQARSSTGRGAADEVVAQARMLEFLPQPICRADLPADSPRPKS